MLLNELYSKHISEISMSPSTLHDFVNKNGDGVEAGFEAELILPFNFSFEQEERTPDFDANKPCKNFDEVREFFIQNEANDLDDVNRAINNAKEKLSEFMQQSLDSMLKRRFEELKTEPEFKNLPSEKRLAMYDQEGDKIVQNFETLRDQRTKTWFTISCPSMHHFYQRYGEGYVSWPYFIDNNDSTKTIKLLAKNLSDKVGFEVKVFDDYHSQTKDTESYYLEPDSSIKGKEGHTGIEIVSPPMPFQKCLQQLRLVLSWAISRGGYTNESTGLHINISLPLVDHRKIDYLKFAMLLGDEYVLKQYQRQANTYCQSMTSKMLKDVKNERYGNIVTILGSMKQGLNSFFMNELSNNLTRQDKYTSINLKQNYIEIRSAGGNYMQELLKIENTMLRYIKALKIAANSEEATQEYAKKLYKFLTSTPSSGNVDAIKLFSMYSAKSLSKEQLKTSLQHLRAQQSDNQQSSAPTAQNNGVMRAWDVSLRSNPDDAVRISARSENEAIRIARPLLSAGENYFPNSAFDISPVG